MNSLARPKPEYWLSIIVDRTENLRRTAAQRNLMYYDNKDPDMQKLIKTLYYLELCAQITRDASMCANTLLANKRASFFMHLMHGAVCISHEMAKPYVRPARSTKISAI